MTGCLFCRIAAGRAPADRVYEDDACLAFRDIRPQAPVHLLVIPKIHISSLEQSDAAPPGLLERLLAACRRVAREAGLAERGYRVVVNTGPEAGQTVFHLHLHVLGGRAMAWPPG